MKEITIGRSTYILSETSQIFLQKYLEKMKTYIEKNKIDTDVYTDIEERISERFDESLKKKVKKELSDRTIIEAVNEIWEPSEIFIDMWIEENEWKSKQTDFKQYFSNKNEQITRNSKKGIIAWVCYGIWERYEIDPLWIRLVFVLGTFLWGTTLILYIVLIILLPDESDSKKKYKNEKENVEKLLKQGEKKIQYVIQSSPPINRFWNTLKKIFLFLFFLFKILLVFVLFVAIIPAITSLLFASWVLFSNISFENKELFSWIHVWFKIWIVGVLLSLTFLTLGIIWKLLQWKTFSNILIVLGITWFLSFVFLGSIWFFNTYQNYLNHDLNIKDLQINIEKMISTETQKPNKFQ